MGHVLFEFAADEADAGGGAGGGDRTPASRAPPVLIRLRVERLPTDAANSLLPSKATSVPFPDKGIKRSASKSPAAAKPEGTAARTRRSVIARTGVLIPEEGVSRILGWRLRGLSTLPSGKSEL